MTKIITRDDVIRYIYKETSTEENSTIEKQLLLDATLMDFYNQSKDTVGKIQEIQLEPSFNSQKRIIEYSGLFNFESIS